MKYLVHLVFVLAATLLLVACSNSQKKTGHASVKITHEPMERYFRPAPSYPIDSLPMLGQRTVEDVLYSYAPYVTRKLKPYFDKAGVSYPPREVTLVGLKEEKTLELWASSRGKQRLVRRYPILAASGGAGPKLRQGDRQVPEGIYRIVSLNPNSHYHLSLRLDYPNAFDLFHAEMDGRVKPGSDIFIHGDSVSAGCLAMGDETIEELFVLAAHTGPENLRVVIAPHDPRKRPLNPGEADLPEWAPELYREISNEILALVKTEPVRVSSNPPAGNRVSQTFR